MNSMHWMGFSRTAVAVAVAVVAAAPALAQNTTASVTGRVAAADGSPVAGATVTILHVESGSSTTATTDAQGRYNARALRPGGPYTITVTGGGLTDRREGVFLALAETTSLDLRLAQAAQTIVITGRGVNDRFNSGAIGAGTNLGSQELAAFASIQRNLQDYARLDPRLAQTDKDRGEISALGQNTRFNSITIDGVTTNDTFGLEANNLPTLKQPISIDAIQSVQINLSNYDVTQKGYTGANINAVTKSGTNDLRGSVYYVFRDSDLAGKRFNRSNGTYFDPPNFKEETLGFTLGGPIIKDRLFFFANYEDFKVPVPSPNFGPLGSSATNVGISPNAVNEAIRIARETHGIDVGVGTIPQGLTTTVKDALLKLDWNITDAHRASVRYTKTEESVPNIAGFSATGLSLSSWWWDQKKTVEGVVAQWFADWSPDFSTEVKVSQRDYDSQPFPVNGARLPAIGLRFSGPLPDNPGVNANNRFLNMGTELSRHFNVLKTETQDIYAGANWFLGDHELKFGFDYAKNEVFNAFLQRVNGNYTFGCEGNAGGPVDYSFGRVGGTDASARVAADCNALPVALREQATLENFQRGLPSFYRVQQPRDGRVLNDAVAVWSYTSTGLFAQDTWRVNNALSLTIGLRMDQQGVPTKPLFNAAAAAAPVAGSLNGTTVTRASGGFGLDNSVTLDGNRLWQPRFGFNWNLGDDNTRRQLRGGFGLFQGAAANVWLSNPFSNTGLATVDVDCGNFNACRTAGAGGTQVAFSPNPATQPRLDGTPAANVDFLSPGLEQPSVWKANLALDTELPELPIVGRLTAGVEWVHTKVNKGITYQHLNLGAPTRTGPDGRQMFFHPTGYDPACFNATGGNITSGACAVPSGITRARALSNPAFNNVLLAKETSQGGGDSVTLSLGQPARAGLAWNVAYTYTAAKEVSPLTSSVSNSNWQNRNIFNPNEEVLQNSNYLIRDRVTASVRWSKAFFGNNRTTVGMFYEGRKGRPYSWTFLNDMNGDGIGGNDLMYVPSAPGSNEVIFRGRSGQTAAEAEAAFWAVVSANPALNAARGGVVGRNNEYAPWVNSVDLRISQELPGFAPRHKTTLTMDILNFGNLLNKEWGRIDEIGFPSNRSFVNYAGIQDGKYVYLLGTTEDFTTRQTKGESQWAVQFTLRYEF